MQVTIHDVAERAGVSISTASRVLSGKGGVRADKARCVAKAAADLNYEPNIFGRVLRGSSTRTVLLVFSRLIVQCLQGMLDAAKAADYCLLLSMTDGPVSDMETFKAVRNGQVDGVIFQDVQIDEPIYQSVLSKVPVVQCGDYIDFAGSNIVSIDNETMAYRMANHLLDHGFERITFICMSDNSSTPGGLSNARERGIRRAMADRGVPSADFSKIVLPLDPLAAREDKNLPGDDPRKLFLSLGRDAIRQVQAMSRQPQAIFCYNDMLAFGCMRELRKSGVCIPQDLAICGFDGIYPASENEPTLTSVVQPYYQMGQAAFTLLLGSIQNKNTTTGRKILLDAIVNCKASTVK